MIIFSVDFVVGKKAETNTHQQKTNKGGSVQLMQTKSYTTESGASLVVQQ